MYNTFICEKCAGSKYEQFSRTQVRCLKCGHVSEFDSGYTPPPTFDFNQSSTILDITKKTDYVRAPMIKRLINYIIDLSSIISITTFVLALINFSAQSIDIAENDIIQIVLVIIAPSYYYFMESKTGKTIGKYVTRTKVISTNGGELTSRQCLFRVLCRIIPFEYISGFLSDGVFWHDSIPGTLVVNDN